MDRKNWNCQECDYKGFYQSFYHFKACCSKRGEFIIHLGCSLIHESKTYHFKCTFPECRKYMHDKHVWEMVKIEAKKELPIPDKCSKCQDRCYSVKGRGEICVRCKEIRNIPVTSETMLNEDPINAKRMARFGQEISQARAQPQPDYSLGQARAQQQPGYSLGQVRAQQQPYTYQNYGWYQPQPDYSLGQVRAQPQPQPQPGYSLGQVREGWYQSQPYQSQQNQQNPKKARTRKASNVVNKRDRKGH